MLSDFKLWPFVSCLPFLSSMAPWCCGPSQLPSKWAPPRLYCPPTSPLTSPLKAPHLISMMPLTRLSTISKTTTQPSCRWPWCQRLCRTRQRSHAHLTRAHSHFRRDRQQHASESVKPLGIRSKEYVLTIPADGSAATLTTNSTLGLYRGLTTFGQLWYYYGGKRMLLLLYVCR